jgi:DNA mismatch repair protein MutS2
MDRHSLSILEYPAVLGLLAREAASAPGREAALRIAPSSDRGWIEAALDGTAEFSLVHSAGGFPSLAPVQDLRPALEVARIPGAVLEAEALLAVAVTLRVAMHARAFFRRAAGAWPRLEAVGARLAPPGGLVAEVERCLEPDGAVADEASPALREVRRQLRATREEVLARLQTMLHAPHLSGHIAEPLVTLRNDRYVIPIKVGSRSAVPGLVHDQSASGLTLYVEPAGVVEANNALRQLHAREAAEVRRVLLGLTAMVRGEQEAIAQTLDALLELDLLAARASLAAGLRASRPKIAEDGRLVLRAARHPLLAARAAALRGGPESSLGAEGQPETVVPIDVELGGAFHVLVITGPNTGGKTVALKTVGLLALMARAGLHLPASPDSQVPLYTGVFADIGDEQSIAQNLSTFSSHMSHIREILAAADGGALVLLDELGAGTDPEEGAALGIAVLEALAAQRTATVATTHLEAIKAFAASYQGVANGSVEFDLDTLRPLYRLTIGLPGKSFAVEIAARLGLPAPVVRRAQAILGEGRSHLRAYLERLQQAAEELDAARRSAAAEAELARGARAEWERRARSVAEEADRYRQEAQQAIREILVEGRRRIGAAVAELRGRAARATPDVIPSAPKAAEALVAGLPALPEPPVDAPADPHAPGLAPEELVPGRRVIVPHLRSQHGTILEPPSPGGKILVQLGVGRVWVAASALAAAPDETPRRAGEAPPATVARPEAPAAGTEINVLGCTADEACARVERFIDDAFLSGLSRVRIVHGKGTGALRRAVADLLKAHPLVECFVLADQSEGGSGATVVTLQGRSAAA